MFGIYCDMTDINRDAMLDWVKGVLIVYVVLGHTMRVGDCVELLDKIVLKGIYGFHMPFVMALVKPASSFCLKIDGSGLSFFILAVCFAIVGCFAVEIVLRKSRMAWLFGMNRSEPLNTLNTRKSLCNSKLLFRVFSVFRG